jgi:hypothetical protein
MISPYALERARAELSSKSLRQIQHETAETWGARALEAYRQYRVTGNKRWLLDGDEYAHEAAEHAALAALDGDAGPLDIIAQLAEARRISARL